MSEEDNFPVTTPKTANESQEDQIQSAHEIIQKQLHDALRPVAKDTQPVQEKKSIFSGFLKKDKKEKVAEIQKPIVEQAHVSTSAPLGNRVIVIGAGLSSLASAALLAKKGYHVTVLEKNINIGGTAGVIEDEGYVFDKNLAECTMPEIVEHYFSLLREDIKDHVTLKKSEITYRVFGPDSKQYDIYPDLEENAIMFDTVEPGAGDKLRAYVGECKKTYEMAKEKFLFRNFDSKFDVLMELQKLKLLSKAGAIIDTTFKSDLLRGILKQQFLFLGTNPADTPDLYSFINQANFIGGIANIEGGTAKLPEALKKITDRYGVQYFTDAPVKRIITNGGTVHGVELLSGRTLEADIVISGADMHHSETSLLPKESQTYPEGYWSKKSMGPSAFILHVGLKEKVSTLLERNVIFPKDMTQSLKQIFSMKKFPDNPIVYVSCPAKTNSAAAPAGKESLFVFVPIPAGVEYGDADLPLYAEKIMHLIEIATGIKDIKAQTDYLKTYCTRDFVKEYNSYKGSAFGLAQTFSQTGPFRPSNMSNKVKNLYYVGANTHPGTSMAMCLISAELAYKRIEGIKTPGSIDSL